MSKRDGFDYRSATIPADALFVEADEPLLVFPSAKAAENFLEAEDVESDCYPAAYGPKGEPYVIRSEGGRVQVDRFKGPSRPDELKLQLLRYLEACEDPADATESLDTLTARAWSIERGHWQRGQGERRRALSLWLGIAFLIALGWIVNRFLR